MRIFQLLAMAVTSTALSGLIVLTTQSIVVSQKVGARSKRKNAAPPGVGVRPVRSYERNQAEGSYKFLEAFSAVACMVACTPPDPSSMRQDNILNPESSKIQDPVCGW